jgi:hypothetical protein
MSVNYMKILIEAGFVKSVESGRLRKIKHRCLPILKKIKAGVISSVHSKRPNFPELVTTAYSHTIVQGG